MKEFPWGMLAIAIVGSALAIGIGGPLVREMVPGKIPLGDGSELGAVSPGPYVHAHCLPPCQVGSHVNIFAGQTTERTWVAVFAEAEGAPRLWYYPTETGVLPEIDPRTNVRAVSEDFRISPSHAQARHWKLHLLLLKNPATREQLAALPPDAAVAHETFNLDLH